MTTGAIVVGIFRFLMEPTWLVVGVLAGLLLPFFRGLAITLVAGAGLTAATTGFDFGLIRAMPLTTTSLLSGTAALGLIFLVVWFLRMYIPTVAG